MKTWDDWSDFEINKAVAQANIMSFESMDEFRPEPYVWDEDSNAVFDPCNSWSDMGPLIDEHGISMSPVGDVWMANNYNPSSAGSFRTQTFAYHKNPLRSAAIVFLEMNGVKP